MISGQPQLTASAANQNNTDAALRSKRWSVVASLFSVAFINYLDRSTIGLALPAITQEFHLTPVAKGALLSLFFWSYTWMQIPIGFAIDRLNTRILFGILFAIWSLACGLTGGANP